MKTKLRMLKLFIVLCGIFATAAVFGQTTYTWTGAADGTNLATAGNWTTNGSTAATTLPDGTFQDIARWDGLTTTNLVLTYGDSGWPGTGPGTLGINFVLTANQSSSVQIISPIPLSASLPVCGITNNSPNAAFTLGDTTANNLTVITRPAGAVHHFVNNSTVACFIRPSVRWQAGDGVGYTYNFSGTGDWDADSFLMPDNNAFSTNFVQVDGPGSTFWIADKTGSYNPSNDTLAAVSINSGTLVIRDSRVFGSAKNQVITNNSSLTFEASTTFNGVISGGGQLIVNGGTLTLATNNTYTGTTTVSNGTLIINGGNAAAATIVNGGTLGGTGTLSGPVTMNVGTALAPGAANSVGTFAINNHLTIGGNLAINVNKSLSPSNDFVVVGGVLTNTGTGTITVANLGPALAVGDKFRLFSKPLQNGAALSVTGFGAFWVNNLAVDGSISVSSTPPVYTWTNAAGGDLATAANWNPNGQPSGYPGPGDTAQWDGVAGGPLNITYGTASLPNTGFLTFGVYLVFTANQVSPVNFTSTASAGSALLAINNIGIASGAGAVTIGNPAGPGPGNTFLFNIVTRPAGALHDFVNNSASAATINGDVRWLAGGGSVYTLDFDGPGNWVVNNYLVNDNGAGNLIQKDGSGTMTWTPVGYLGNGALNSPITINAGTLVLAGSHSRLGKQAIVNTGTFQFNAPAQSQTLSGIISGSGLLQVKNGTLTLAGTNTYSGGTTIAAGTLQVGTNGTSGTLGTGNVTNHSSLIFNRSDSATFGNAIGGAGSVVQNGSGTLTLAGANTYTGPTTVSNGTLVVNSVGGNVNVSGGTITPTGVGAIGTLTVAGDMSISAGTVLATLNKSLSPSNSVFSVVGNITASGGILKLLNFGPSLVVGDKFTLFSQPVTGGAGMTMVSPGFTVANSLAVDGSVTVTSVAPPATVTATVAGGQLNLSWPAAWTGLHLQVQTNPLTIGLSTNWVTIPGTDAGNSYMTPLNNANVSVFYRLAL